MIRKLPLHLKTALLASVVSFVVLGSGLVVISASIARQIQENEKEIVRLQVENIADQLSASSESFDDKDLKNLTNFLSGSRPNLVTVRIWRIEDGRFVEMVSSDDSLPVDDLSPEFANALQAGSDISEVRGLTGSSDSYFRVLARIASKGRAIGAVEGVEKLDTMATITWRYVADLSLITLATFFLLSGSIYLMFRRLVYRLAFHSQPTKGAEQEAAKSDGLLWNLTRRSRGNDPLFKNADEPLLKLVEKATASRRITALVLRIPFPVTIVALGVLGLRSFDRSLRGFCFTGKCDRYRNQHDQRRDKFSHSVVSLFCR